MRIDHLELTNFKNYSNLVVDFSPGVNLFVGSNGSGKTGILEAVNVAVGCFFGSQEQKMQRFIDHNEIKIAELQKAESAKISAISSDLNLSWSRSIKRDTKTNDTKGTAPINAYGKTFFTAFEEKDNRTVAPLIAYYSTQRLFKDASLSKKQEYYASVGRKNGYLQCLKENAIKPALNEWLSKATITRNTKIAKQIPDNDLVLDNVEKTIESVIKFFYSPNTITKDEFKPQIYYNSIFDDLFLWLDKEHDLPISYYSDGIRNLIYLVIDLVWRASQLNPWLNLQEIKEHVCGVVTIDEVDLHLHPKWQAKAVSFIQNLFPNVQFFITTHSPTVVANYECRLNKDSLFTIDNNGVDKVHEKFFGKQVDNILREILGAPDRHVPTQQKIDLLLRKIDEDAPEQEINNLLAELTELLGRDDVDVERAVTLIDWKKIEKEDADAVHS